MVLTIPLAKYPNQVVSSMIVGQVWTITLDTRNDGLYVTIENQKNGLIVANRVCLNRTPITHNFVFIDMNGNSDPVYTGLGERYQLVWSDE